MKERAVHLLALAVFLGVVFAAAGAGGAFTAQSVGDWYKALRRPAWTPPDWLFGPVWTVLYAAMGVAAWLVWREGSAPARWALGLFALQLALNVAWSAVFFGLRSPGAAFAEIVLLWAAILATTVAFWRVTPRGAWLLLPYLGWVTFAAALNFAIWRMNA